jgi:CxxC-x17-CxxC domain-containing protein
MFEASCNKCGNKCEVPFLPNGKKPVYCRDCFVREDGQDSRNNFIKKEWAPKPSFDRAPAGHGPAAHGGPDMKDVVRELAAVNAKLDTLIRVMQDAA